MKKTRKIIIALVLVMTLLMSLAMAVIPASAVNITGGTKLYLVPNANWNQSNARFAAYFFGDGEAWVSMTKVAGQSNLYEVTAPAGKNFTNVIFCRMNPSASANNWNNKWNQTSDLVYNGTSNCYTVKEGTWDKGGGTWSTYGSACSHTNVGPAATCTTAQVCKDCGDPVVEALGHTYNSSHLCTRCNGQATFTVAGSGAHLGTEWDTGNTANDMTYADGVYTKVYTNVAAGSYALKVARDHDWGTAYPSADKAYTVSTAGSTVTVTLKGTTVTVTVEVPHVCSFSEPTCTEPGKCSCGKTQGEALGHSYEAVVTAPTFDAEGYTTYTCSCGDSYVADNVPAKVAVATANGEKYETLAEALANGNEIVLLANIEIDAPIVITGSYVIDLNGYTLSYTSTVIGEAMITNKGSLVINDSSDAKSGVINYNYVGANDASYGKGNYTISNSGNLTINGGKITIANLRSHAKYPIDNNSTTGDAILVINGGHLYNYNTSAIRMFCNSTTYKNSVTINGGIVEGYSAIWMQNPGSKTVHGSLEINGGEIRTTAAAYVNGTAELKDVSSNLYTTIDGNGGAWSEDSFISLLGGTFNENVNIYYEAPANVTVGEDAQFNGNCYYVVPHVHSWSDATCTEPQKCECGETQGDALGHNYVEDYHPSTCTNPGYTQIVCSKCGDVTSTISHPAKGHVDAEPVDHECDVCGLSISACKDDNKDHKCDICKDVMSVCVDADKNHNCDICGVQNSHCIDLPPYDHICDWCGEKASEHNYVEGVCSICGAEDPNYVPPHVHSYNSVVTAPTCTAKGYTTYTCECGESYVADEVAALGHTWNNCECACGAVLPTLSANDSFSFATQANFDAAVASGKLAFVGSFRDNGGSFQFNSNSSIQFVVPANTTVSIAGHSAQYGVFNVYLNGEKTAMEGNLTFTVTEETKVVIATGDNGASYSYIKSIALQEYVDRTISSDTTITFGSEGNYKNSVVDFSGIQIGDNGGNNSQVKNGSFNLILKGNMAVTIHGYPGYTSYKINGGEAIESEYYTIYTEGDTVLTITPVSGNNYFYSIEIKSHAHVWSDATCTEPSKCECGKTQGEALGHSYNAVVTAPDCVNGGYTTYTCACGNSYVADETAALGHSYETVVTNPTCTEAGATVYTCACGDSYSETIAALGHSHEAVVTAPTCTEAGYTTYTCACGDSYVADETAALGHTFVNGVCSVCGAADPDYVPHVNALVVGENNKIVITGETLNPYGFPIEWITFVADEAAHYAFAGEGATIAIFDLEGNLLCNYTGEADLEAGYYLICVGAYFTGEFYVTAVKTAIEIPHEHNFVDGKCECGESDPNYVPPHEHNFVDGKCECGESDPNYVPPHEHEFVDGKCECGEIDPDYVAPEQPEDETPEETPEEQPAPEQPAPKLTFIQKVVKAVTDFFKSIGSFFKGLFGKK